MNLFLPVLAAVVTNFSGIVTFERGDLSFFFMRSDDGVNWRVERRDGVDAKTGDRVQVSGRREATSKHRLADTDVKILDVGLEPPLPRTVAIPDLFAALMPYGNTSLYGEVMSSEGVLRDINRRQNTTQLLVGEGEFNLQVELPCPLSTPLPNWMVPGATVKVTGALAYTSIENLDEGVFGRIENVELIPESLEDVEIVHRAPFWTGWRLVALFAALLFLVASASIWALLLRVAVARRSRQLAETIRMNETVRIEEDAVRRERLRLAADLHDGFQQYLAGAKFRLAAAMNYLPEGAGESMAQLEKVKEAIEHTQSGLRSTLWALNEESMGPESVTKLFEFASRRMPHWAGIVDIKSSGTERNVARRMAATLLLVMQEAVGNALKSGAAEHVRVRLEFGEKELAMSVIDDGAGFDVAAAEASPGHYGLGTMRRRVSELGGTISIWSKIGLGTKISVRVPFQGLGARVPCTPDP